MAVSKVVYGNQVLIDLTGDTVAPETLKKGTTAHDMSGKAIIGTLEVSSSEFDEIDCMLNHGFKDGTRTISSNGDVHAVSSDGWTLDVSFSNDYNTCSRVLTDPKGNNWSMTKEYDPTNPLVITITDRYGNTTVKTISSTDDEISTTIMPA